MQILVYEHVSGGGFAGKRIPIRDLCEGYAMLRIATLGFKSAGHSVTTLLDSRIDKCNPPLKADRIIPVHSSGNVANILKKTTESLEATLVIAPESNNVLRSMVKTVETTGSALLNCTSSIIGLVSNKAALYEHLKAIGISTPKTLMLNGRSNIDDIKRAVYSRFRFPLVVKPIIGEGGSGLSLVTNDEQLAVAVEKALRETSSEYCLVQEFIQGVTASVSLISTGQMVLPVSLNWQNIALRAPELVSSYEGGFVPLKSQLRDEAFSVATKAVASFGGLVGYVGVDVILAEDRVVLIEINPRLTTSIVGLNRVTNFNLSQALLDAALEGRLTSEVETSGYTLFSKVLAFTPASNVFSEISKMDAVVSPPFPVDQDYKTFALVQGQGFTLKAALLRFNEAKKTLLQISHGGK